MTFHRTAGTGGSRNSKRERHCTDMPNFNKMQGSGVNRRGKKQNNPPTKGKTTPEQRYKRMMQGTAPKKTLEEEFGSRFLGKSKVTGRY